MWPQSSILCAQIGPLWAQFSIFVGIYQYVLLAQIKTFLMAQIVFL